MLTPKGQVISLQDLIVARPEAVIGEDGSVFQIAVRKPNLAIVSKKFGNLNPIPHHLHWAKWEVYDINSYDNPGVNPSHYHTTAMGLYPFVTRMSSWHYEALWKGCLQRCTAFVSSCHDAYR